MSLTQKPETHSVLDVRLSTWQCLPSTSSAFRATSRPMTNSNTVWIPRCRLTVVAGCAITSKSASRVASVAVLGRRPKAFYHCSIRTSFLCLVYLILIFESVVARSSVGFRSSLILSRGTSSAATTSSNLRLFFRCGLDLPNRGADDHSAVAVRSVGCWTLVGRCCCCSCNKDKGQLPGNCNIGRRPDEKAKLLQVLWCGNIDRRW